MQADLSPRAGIGPALRRARESRGLSLHDASRTTRIRPRYLRALEEDAPPDRFPGQVYERFFLREYARYLGVDEEPLVGVLQQREQPAPPPLEPLRELAPPRRWVQRVVTFGAAALLAGLAAVSVATSRSDDEPIIPGAPPVVVTEPPADADVAGARPQPRIVAKIALQEASWVRVISDGARDVKRTVEAGSTLRLGARHRMFVTIRDPVAATLRVNGERVEMTEAPFRARFVFDRGEIVLR